MTHRLARFQIPAHESPAILFMPLTLVALTGDQVRGIYGKRKNELPERMRYLSPAAAQSYVEDLSSVVVVSDMFRSAESSLQAKRERRGAQRPAYSGHNYGYSIDIDVGATMKALGLNTKRELDAWMNARGWYRWSSEPATREPGSE